MLSTQYRCSCCNQAVMASEKDCPNCGSHNIKSPYRFWIFCSITCLALVVILKMTQLYFTDHREIPVTESFFKVISDKHK